MAPKKRSNPIVRFFTWYEVAFYNVVQWPFKALVWLGEVIVRAKLFPILMTIIIVWIVWDLFILFNL
jgi:hypothetical protein